MSRQGGPSYGPQGARRLQVHTNSFKITGIPQKPYYQYDAFENERVSKEARRRIEVIERLQNLTKPDIFKKKVIYDSDKIAYSATELSFGNACSFDVNMMDRAPKEGTGQGRGIIRVNFRRVDALPVSFEDLQRFIDGRTNESTPRAKVALNLVQLILRQGPNLKYPNNEKAFFCREAGARIAGPGLEILKGFYQSVRPAFKSLLVNIDTSCGVLYQQGPIIDIACSLLGANNPRRLVTSESADLAKLKKFFKGVLVTFTHRKGLKKIESIVPRAGLEEFEWNKEKGDVIQRTTVKAYLFELYNIDLRFPEAVGVKVGGSSIVPIELCIIAPNQRYRQRLTPEMTKQMVDATSQKPWDRLKTIRRSVEDRGAPLDYSSSPFVRDAELAVSTQPVVIDGKVMSTPGIEYSGGARVFPRAGSWNVVNQRFKEPKSINCWAVVDYSPNPSRDRERNERFVRMLHDNCQKLGTSNSHSEWVSPRGFPTYERSQILEAMTPPRDYINGNGSAPTEPLKQLARQAAQHNTALDMILIILPVSAADIRTSVKRWGDVLEGVVTQCVRVDKVAKANDQYCNNVAMKINAKLGGVNAVPRSDVMKKLMDRGFIVMGADVGHPAPGVRDQPSVASLVASYDMDAMKYNAYTTVQQPRLETIDQLQAMVASALETFGNQWRAGPHRIFFYRDGLSEGEYERAGDKESVAEKEIKEIKAAVDEVWRVNKATQPKPALTYIIVGKKHHVRFFPMGQQDADKSGNCPAGFVADQGIGNPIAKGYYLLSHGGLLGTSRPSHYVVILDENFSSNTEILQELSFSLCHAYARATRSVSIPAPVYYADLVCSRANFHFDPQLKYDDSSASVSSGKPVFDLERWARGFQGPHRNMLKKMFYM